MTAIFGARPSAFAVFYRLSEQDALLYRQDMICAGLWAFAGVGAALNQMRQCRDLAGRRILDAARNSDRP